MRETDRKDGFSLQAISGTRAVMLAMNANQTNLDDFLGFAVGTRSGNGHINWLRGFKYFPSLVPDAPRGQRFSTVKHPIQDFKWGYYWAKPETDYSFVVRPLFKPDNGDLANLRSGTDLEVTIRTESETNGKHSILFNRGAIVSQKYSEEFDDDSLTEDELAEQLNDPQSERTQWLSRGLLEGLLGFIDQARNSQFSLHGCFYELTYPPVLEALAAAAGRGATVEVTYDAGFSNVAKTSGLKRQMEKGMRRPSHHSWDSQTSPFMNASITSTLLTTSSLCCRRTVIRCKYGPDQPILRHLGLPARAIPAISFAMKESHRCISRTGK